MSVQEIDHPEFFDSLDEIAPPCAATSLIGHEPSMEQIFSAISGGHHALILDGERGIGKATSAFLTANAVLGDVSLTGAQVLYSCDAGSTTYRQIAQNVHPNMLYLTRPKKDDGKGFKTVITVDEVRRLQRFLGMTSSAGEKRVIIIDSLGDMNRNAANAVLKLLEEPPINTLFLLVCHGLGGILPTIRSRCQVVKFHPLDNAQVRAVLDMAAGSILDADQLPQLTALSGGSVRHALLMALNGGLELKENLDAFLNTAQFDTARAHKLADVAGARGSDTHNILLRHMMFEAIQQAAIQAANNGNIHRAAQIARFDEEFGERAHIADGFNLDRKQEFLIMANKVHSLLHTA
jgi:DNA polymerase-3 subunit delta'